MFSAIASREPSREDVEQQSEHLLRGDIGLFVDAHDRGLRVEGFGVFLELSAARATAFPPSVRLVR